MPMRCDIIDFRSLKNRPLSTCMYHILGRIKQKTSKANLAPMMFATKVRIPYQALLRIRQTSRMLIYKYFVFQMYLLLHAHLRQSHSYGITMV